MARVNDPVELGRVVRARRRELHETQQAIADVCGASRGSVGKLERGAGGVQLRIALIVVQTLGLNVEVASRDAGGSRCGDAGVRSCARTRVPADVGLFLRGALYVGLARVTADISDQCSLEDPGDVAGLLAHFDRIRGLLDHIGWEKKPQQHHDLEVDDAHRQTLVETLEEDRESWDWLSHQEATETVEGRKRAAVRAERIKRFLASIAGAEVDA